MAADIKRGNSRKNWTARKPFAYWKGNIYTGHRINLAKCGSIEEWNTEIIHVVTPIFYLPQTHVLPPHACLRHRNYPRHPGSTLNYGAHHNKFTRGV